MPTLEDTVEFQALTLNDLLEADAKAVALPSEGEGKYRSWAFISTAAAGLLAILLVVALVTDSGGGSSDGGGSAKSAKSYPGTSNVPIRVVNIPGDVKPDVYVRVLDPKDGKPVLAGVPVVTVTPPEGPALVSTMELALTDEESAILTQAFPRGDEKVRVQKVDGPAPSTPTTTAPAETPTTAPAAPTPAETAPPPQTPPATG
jgi:hypothetical protein